MKWNEVDEENLWFELIEMFYYETVHYIYMYYIHFILFYIFFD